MAFADILHKLIVLEVILIIVKLVILVWLFFRQISPVALLVVAFGSSILLKLLYTLIRRHYEQE